jgi:hypothetical protein
MYSYYIFMRVLCAISPSAFTVVIEIRKPVSSDAGRILCFSRSGRQTTCMRGPLCDAIEKAVTEVCITCLLL